MAIQKRAKKRPAIGLFVVGGVVGLWKAGKWVGKKVNVTYVRKVGKGFLIRTEGSLTFFHYSPLPSILRRICRRTASALP
jgi:hypothetical protein